MIGMAAGVLGVVGVVGAAAGHPVTLLPLLLGVGFCLYFFRDPERQPPSGDDLIISPADGRVLEVVPGREEQFLHARDACQHLHVTARRAREPQPGHRHVELVRTGGPFRAAFADKASLDNERNAVVPAAAGATSVWIVRGARRTRARQPGDHLTRGNGSG